MAQVSDWSILEQNNVKLDDLTLSGEGGLYSNKIMCAVKKKFDEIDGKLESVQGAYVFKGVKADMTALEAVEDPEVGDVYSVTASGGENFAWDGEAWDSLGTSDAGVVHKTGDETVGGEKTFTSRVAVQRDNPYFHLIETDWGKGDSEGNAGYQGLLCKDKDGNTGCSIIYHYSPSSGNSYVDFLVNDMHTANADGSCSVTLSYNVSDGPKFTPTPTASMILGSSSNKWKEIWCSQNSLNSSSDKRMKQSISQVPDDVLDAWGEIDWVQYKFNDAVAEKGTEAARMHNGLIAQDIEDKFKEKGLDIERYGLFLYDEWPAEPEELDEEGNVARHAVEAGSAYGLRYVEALCMEASYQRRRADRLEARIEALEAQLNG